MGCGPCGSSQAVVEPEKLIIPVVTLEKKIINLIEQYKKLPQQSIYPILSLQQCEQVQAYLASNTNLPEISQNTSNKQQLESNPGIPAGQRSFLLTDLERIVWKCLLIIPFYNPSDHTTLPNPYYLENIEQKCKNSFYQISLDVNRTFPSNSKINRQSLSRILQNLASTYPGLGYFQGMNYYAGFVLLCGFSEQEAFHLLVILFVSREYFFAHSFQHGFMQTMTACKVLSESIDARLKELLEYHNIFDQLYSFQWFLCCFLITLEPQISATIWDKMIKLSYEGLTRKNQVGGISFITTVGFEIMNFLKEQLLEKDTPDGILNILRSDSLRKKIKTKQINAIVKRIEKKMKNIVFSQKIGKEMVVTRQLFLEKDKKLTEVLAKKESYVEYLQELKGKNQRK